VVIKLRTHDEFNVGMYAVEVVKEVIQFFWSTWQYHEHIINMEPGGELAGHPAECHFFKFSI